MVKIVEYRGTIAEFAMTLRVEPNITPGMLVRAADTIDTLLEVIALQRGRPELEPDPDWKPLGRLREWHHFEYRVARDNSDARQRIFHADAVRTLNAYFTHKLEVD